VESKAISFFIMRVLMAAWTPEKNGFAKIKAAFHKNAVLKWYAAAAGAYQIKIRPIISP
jgi:hypothetical protein